MTEWSTRLNADDGDMYFALFEPKEHVNRSTVIIILLPQTGLDIWVECQMAIDLQCRIVVCGDDDDFLRTAALLIEKLQMPGYQRLALETAQAFYEKNIEGTTEH